MYKSISLNKVKDVLDYIPCGLSHLAAARGHIYILEWLHATNVTLKHIDSNGATALHYAVIHNQLPTVHYLIESGFLTDTPTADGSTVLHCAIKKGYFDIVKCLVEKGANVNVKNNEGETVLHWAAEKGYVDILKYLLDKGANINEKDKDGQTALHLSA